MSASTHTGPEGSTRPGQTASTRRRAASTQGPTLEQRVQGVENAIAEYRQVLPPAIVSTLLPQTEALQEWIRTEREYAAGGPLPPVVAAMFESEFKRLQTALDKSLLKYVKLNEDRITVLSDSFFRGLQDVQDDVIQVDSKVERNRGSILSLARRLRQIEIQNSGLPRKQLRFYAFVSAAWGVIIMIAFHVIPWVGVNPPKNVHSPLNNWLLDIVFGVVLGYLLYRLLKEWGKSAQTKAYVKKIRAEAKQAEVEQAGAEPKHMANGQPVVAANQPSRHTANGQSAAAANQPAPTSAPTATIPMTIVPAADTAPGQPPSASPPPVS